MLVLLPVLESLARHYPGATVDVVCETRNAPVLDLAGGSRRTLAYDSHPWRLWRALRSAGYDLAIDTEQFHHFSAVFAALSRAPVRIGFKINPLRNPLYTHLVGYDPDGSEPAQFARLLRPLGVAAPSGPRAGLLEGAVLPAPAVLQAQNAAPFHGGNYVALHPGGAGRYKQWAADRFAELAARLHREFGLGSAIVGDRPDIPLGQSIVQACRAAGVPVLSCQGGLALAETAAVIRRARLFVGTDSGLAHLAIALGRPTVVLFGPSDAVKWGVDDERHATVRADLGCAPCFIFGYHKPCRHVACMRQIGVEAVMAACRRVLEG